MVSSSGHGVAAVTLPKFSTLGDPRRNCEKFIQLFKNWCVLNGWYDSEPLPPPTKEGGEPPPTGSVWLAKGKSRTRKPRERLSALQEELKEPEIIFKHLKEHFMANEGVLTERTKFAQMKQKPRESVTAWEGRVKEQGRRLDYCANCEDQHKERLMSKLLATVLQG